MAVDFSKLVFDFAIFHRVFKPIKRCERRPPQISQNIVIFENENFTAGLFIKSEIIKVMDQSAVNITFDNTIKSQTPTLIKDLFRIMSEEINNKKSKNENFIKISTSLAQILNDKQDARSSNGILAIFYGHLDKKQVLVIAKLEEETGLQINESTENNGLNIGIQVIEKILRMHKSNVLKVGVFSFEPKIEGKNDPEIIGFLCDTQSRGESEVADFYLKKFLGCKFVNDAKKQTQDFFNASLEFIGTNFDSPNEQVEYREKLCSFVLSESYLLIPKNFIDEFVPIEKKDALEGYYETNNIELNGFAKDTEYIKTEVEKMKIIFENGISIIGGSINFANEVKIEQIIDGETTITINSNIRKMPLKFTQKRTEKINQFDDNQ
jgi:hypothetical protein